jgi:hypothetical protein
MLGKGTRKVVSTVWRSTVHSYEFLRKRHLQCLACLKKLVQFFIANLC